MTAPDAREFPIPVPNPDAVPSSDGHLLALAHVRPRELTNRELLAGTCTLVDRLYDTSVVHVTLRDSTTVDVSFATGEELRIELLADDADLAAEDVRQLLELRPEGRLLVVLAGNVSSAARRLVVDHPRVDYASLSVERKRAGVQIDRWFV